MCRYSQKSYRKTLICLECRVGWKGPRDSFFHEFGSLHCSRCGRPGIDMGHDFKVPRKRKENQWRKIELMIRQGYDWQTCGCKGPGRRPRTLADAKQGKIK